MSFNEFNESLDFEKPPELNPYLKALWFDKKGSWRSAHELAQELHDKPGSRIHAYLHRKEGDLQNAEYWYNRAGIKLPDISIEQEWMELTLLLLDHGK